MWPRLGPEGVERCFISLPNLFFDPTPPQAEPGIWWFKRMGQESERVYKVGLYCLLSGFLTLVKDLKMVFVIFLLKIPPSPLHCFGKNRA